MLRTRLGQRGVRDEHSDQAAQWPVGTRGSTRQGNKGTEQGRKFAL